MTRRKAAFLMMGGGVSLNLLAESSVAADGKPVREFVFILSRFNCLLLTTDNAGYRLCLVEDDRPGELMRTSFSGFSLLKESETSLLFAARYEDPFSEDELPFISLELHKDNDRGERSNRNINYGEWVMRISGRGFRFEEVRQMLIERRVSVLWTPEDPMVFRGEIASDQFGDETLDYLHR